MTINTENTEIIIFPPTQKGELSLKQINEVLSRKIPKTMLKQLKDKGNCDYIPWYEVNKILDKYCLGWEWKITNIVTTSDRIFLTGCLSIPTSEGVVSREAMGTETLKLIKRDGSQVEHPYGDPSSNAESMAFRRCAAKFGLGLYLY